MTAPYFRYKSRTYVTGRIIDIEPDAFDKIFVVKVEEPQPVEAPTTEVVTVGPQEPMHTGGPKPEESPLPEDKAKVKRVLKTNAA
ncbi:hypothetical protein MUP79_05655 [Candidatus Bathyarchaeota archaeon]|nr:hypothetical protein [Candidatus Bathyarchaeota archaeon]